MEKQKLPNSTLILVFGILSILTCCCYGVIGLILGIVAVVLANKAIKLYASAPDQYEGIKNVRTGKIMAIIGIILNVIYAAWSLYFLITYGIDGIQQMQQDMLQELGGS